MATFLTTCPTCEFEGRIPEHYVGQSIRCRHCATVFMTAPLVFDPEEVFFRRLQNLQNGWDRAESVPVEEVAAALLLAQDETD